MQAEQLSKKGMQLTADKAAVESTLSLKEEQVWPSTALILYQSASNAPTEQPTPAYVHC